MAIHEAAHTIEQDPELARYSRQMLFAPLGEEGQRRLLAARVTLIGCGALGSVLANTLVRAGVGFLRIVDRDFIELNNLQRQVLFDEDDIAANLPKAEAARRKLQRINSNVTIEARIADVTHRNIEELADGADLLLDGTDNFETRFLINDFCVKTNRPWVYGAVIGATGLALSILPHDTPCLRCVFETAPPPEMNPTCDTAGVLGPAVNMVASFQAAEAIKILAGRREAVNRRLLSFDLWAGRFALLKVQKAYDEGDCPCCKRGQFEYLEGRWASSATTLCGRNAVQVTPPAGQRVDFAIIAAKMRAVSVGEPSFNAFMLKARVDAFEVTVFADGRAIIKGTSKPEEAKTIYARYIGA
ncbi:MAG TPA: ThiF family adenylyltransferase [Phycisphaerae bacterium]|nr:thiazole biosynthesis adenylyltransferase ThiF [Phycisphaerae bacterium]HOB74443.1 ThiF family adenylyltransferase [Phycisphaerae bacterium]HOJ54271.1 ThiF family adenylyltransferase [Phycisphaerae bacterium]HOL26742.1 ThiF family adenylyltransferase [Phycisphaerae bacterium]HPP20628.1 ThiF family adenylyltransferase [Phycisphaerae bacterium]